MSENERHNRHTPPVSVEQLQAYLQSKQWFEDGKIRNVATIWHRHQDEDAEVVLPASNAKDFQQRVRDALIALASFDGDCQASCRLNVFIHAAISYSKSPFFSSSLMC